jgi:hypothetical protein
MSAFEFSCPLGIFACIGFMEFAKVNRRVFACDPTRIRKIDYRSESIGKVESTAVD